MSVLKTGSCPMNEVCPATFTLDNMHPALNHTYVHFVQKFFEEYLKVHGLLTVPENREELYSFITDEELLKNVKSKLSGMTDPEAMWKTFINCCCDKAKDKKDKTSKSIPLRIAMTYVYPRFDANVTTTVNHLLKAPFCVHPGSDKISVPIDFDHIDKFDIDKVPTLTGMYREMHDENGDLRPCKTIEPYMEVFRKFVNELNTPDQHA